MSEVSDIFKLGIGPSSSHTVGPMLIAAQLASELSHAGKLHLVRSVKVNLRGALAFTGPGHGTLRAVSLGLMGFRPEVLDPDLAEDAYRGMHASGTISLNGEHPVEFVERLNVICDFETLPTLHPNEMHCVFESASGEQLLNEVWYSVGGGQVMRGCELAAERERRTNSGEGESASELQECDTVLPYCSAAELVAICDKQSLSVADVVRINEVSVQSEQALDAKLDTIRREMNACIDRGLSTSGILPGGLNVSRRAPALWDSLCRKILPNEPENLFDYLNVYALAVNEENAAGGRVVTAPTNGAAGIIPAILRQYCPELDRDRAKAHIFLLTATAIGSLFKRRASISGAEMGCQGEVGVACAMAAGGLAAIWGGSPRQLCCAAEIAMEHNLGLTCDPVGGLVQIPCIERNAIAATKATNSARLALHGTGETRVSLDEVIETMRQTGIDMSDKYKETSKGGLAVNLVEC